MGLLDCHNSTRKCWTNCITYNEVCIIIRQGLENVETFSSKPRPTPRLFLQDQDQDQGLYFKTKTIFQVLEAPRDQGQGLETTSLALSLLICVKWQPSTARKRFPILLANWTAPKQKVFCLVALLSAYGSKTVKC